MDARRMWRIFEPIHDLTYFTPEALTAYAEVGLRGYWRGYFAGRAAPLGVVNAAPVIAIFYVFAPSMVARALPAVWSMASPEQSLIARSAGAEAAMNRILGTIDVDPDELAEAATIAEKAVGLLDFAGRPLGSANAALPVDPDASPAVRLWQATATLREHRGDGHMAALLSHGFGGCEAAIWRHAPEHREQVQSIRGWTAEEVDAAAARLTDRGWLDGDGHRTEAGDAAYAAVEASTDRAAAAVWQALGEDATTRLGTLLLPIAHAAYAALPADNPVLVGAPPAA